MKYRLGRKALLAAVRDARPVRFQVAEAWFSAYLSYELHRLSGRTTRLSDIEQGDIRVWFICLGCRRRVRKLYFFPVSVRDGQLSDIRCRRCHGLIYQSQNCGGNRWWREIARPLKGLLRRRQRFLARKQSARLLAQLGEIDQAVWILRQRAVPKTRPGRKAAERPHSLRIKRPYRSVGLLEP